jgi:hypothetical protein
VKTTVGTDNTREVSLLMVLALLCLSVGTTNAQTRVALVSTCGGDAGEKVLALAEAKLSKEKDIALLERTLVERALDEQKLTRCGLSDSAQAVAVGKLLGVEVFATLETFPSSDEALGLVAFDARSGAKLWDAALPSGGADKAAAGVVDAVQRACQKRLQPLVDRRTICLLSVRNADFPRAMDSFCESVGQLLERSLLGSASLTVLERERLEQINRERALPTDVTTDDLLASLAILELEFSRGSESNGIRAAGFLTDPSGTSLGKVRAVGDVAHVSDLVESLLQKLTEFLKAAPSDRTVDRAGEAQRFRQEATFAMQQEMPIKALQAAEAAYALEPSNQVSRALLAEMLFGAASSLIQPRRHTIEDVRRALGLADRGADICLELRGQMTTPKTGTSAEGALQHFLTIGIDWAGSTDIEFQRERMQVKGKYRNLLMDREKQILVTNAGAADLGFAYPGQVHFFMEALESASPTRAGWASDVVTTLNDWLLLLDKKALCSIDVEDVNWAFSPLIYYLRNTDMPSFTRMASVFDRLKQEETPLLRLYGITSEIDPSASKQLSATDANTRLLEQVEHLAKDTIANPPCKKPDYYRIAVYQAWLDAIDMLGDPVVRRQQYQKVFEFMLERREFVEWVSLAAIDPQPYRFGFYRYWGTWFPRDDTTPGDAAVCAQNVAKLQRLLESPDYHTLKGRYRIGRTGGWEQELQRVRQRIAELEPTLIPSNPAPWSATRLLYDAPRPLLQPHVFGDSVWALESPVSTSRASDLRLVRIPLDGSPSTRYDHIPSDGPPDRFYAAAVQDGIVIFPADAAAVNFLTDTNGLPTKYVHGVACCDGKLYAGICRNEGYLGTGYRGNPSYVIACDLATGKVKLLASSLRKEKLSALDDVPSSYFIRQMIADPARHRVLFSADIGMYQASASCIGVWSIDTKDDKLTQLMPLNGYCQWLSPIHNDEILFTRCLRASRIAYEVFSLDLKKDKPRLLSSPLDDTRQYLVGDEPVYIIPWQSYPPHLIVDGWLWCAGPFSRIPIRGPREFLPSPATGSSFVDYRHVNYLELLASRRKVVAGLDHQLWLLDLRPNEAETKDKSKVSP